MEYVAGQTLHKRIHHGRLQGSHREDEFRAIARQLAEGLTAIHQEGFAHGDLKPGNIMVNDQRAVILDFGFTQERARAASQRMGAAADGGTPHYMSPERLHLGGTSPEDDVYALGLTLWEMWSGRVPEPGSRPRNTPMNAQLAFDTPSKLSVDEIKQIWRCLSEDPSARPSARHLKFFKPSTLTTVAIPRERLEAGPRPTPSLAQQFVAGAQSLLVTYASHATDSVGQLFPLTKPLLKLGRHSDQDIVVPEATVSGSHALLRWQAGQWAVEDLGSTNGTFTEYAEERVRRVVLLHGSEVQVGELRLRLVSFSSGSMHHQRARAFLGKRDGLTELLLRPYLDRSADDEALFAQWADFTMTVARYQLCGPTGVGAERRGIPEMLALRKAARRAVHQTEQLLLSLWPVVAGLTGPLRFAVVMVGPTLEEAQQIVEQVKAQVRPTLPSSMDLEVTVVRALAGIDGQLFLE
jgi:serine/threonine-protein kinase